jgi:dienelactone hydrolase
MLETLTLVRKRGKNMTKLALCPTGKYFEMKVYQGGPHGFMIEDGQLSESFASEDAFWQMITFFDRTLK